MKYRTIFVPIYFLFNSKFSIWNEKSSTRVNIEGVKTVGSHISLKSYNTDFIVNYTTGTFTKDCIQYYEYDRVSGSCTLDSGCVGLKHRIVHDGVFFGASTSVCYGRRVGTDVQEHLYSTSIYGINYAFASLLKGKGGSSLAFAIHARDVVIRDVDRHRDVFVNKDMLDLFTSDDFFDNSMITKDYLTFVDFDRRDFLDTLFKSAVPSVRFPENVVNHDYIALIDSFATFDCDGKTFNFPDCGGYVPFNTTHKVCRNTFDLNKISNQTCPNDFIPVADFTRNVTIPLEDGRKNIFLSTVDYLFNKLTIALRSVFEQIVDFFIEHAFEFANSAVDACLKLFDKHSDDIADFFAKFAKLISSFFSVVLKTYLKVDKTFPITEFLFVFLIVDRFLGYKIAFICAYFVIWFISFRKLISLQFLLDEKSTDIILMV